MDELDARFAPGPRETADHGGDQIGEQNRPEQMAAGNVGDAGNREVMGKDAVTETAGRRSPPNEPALEKPLLDAIVAVLRYGQRADKDEHQGGRQTKDGETQ